MSNDKEADTSISTEMEIYTSNPCRNSAKVDSLWSSLCGVSIAYKNMPESVCQEAGHSNKTKKPLQTSNGN
jgi:hypothetical protein